ncbi:MAG: rod shape-determining protein [Clostridia bacterium]|nr:rod shape-determining protein [Clostridia bacterium]
MLWEYGIDAGSENLRLVKRGTPQIVRESTYTAIREGRGTPFAWGDRALMMLGRAPKGVSIVKSVNHGCVDRANLFAKWARIILDEDEAILKKSTILVGVNETMRKDAVEEMQKRMLDEGISGVAVVSSAILSALGAGEKALEPEAVCLLDVGAEQMQAAVISGGRIVKSEHLPFGAARADQTLIEAVRIYLGCAIGPHTARELIKELGKTELNDNAAVEVNAFDYKTNLPKKRKIPALLVKRCLSEIVDAAAEMCEKLVTFLPEEIAGDVSKHGFVITGGGARLMDFASAVEEQTGLSVRLAEAPEDCLAKGLQRVLNSQKTYARLITGEMEESRRP